MNSNKVSGRLATMATILYPDLKGKMSGKQIRKSAVTNFQKLPAAVTSLISNHDFAKHMSQSDGTANRFYNLSDIMRQSTYGSVHQDNNHGPSGQGTFRFS